jgi:hypothetical protein
MKAVRVLSVVTDGMLFVVVWVPLVVEDGALFVAVWVSSVVEDGALFVVVRLSSVVEDGVVKLEHPHNGSTASEKIRMRANTFFMGIPPLLLHQR